MSPCHPFRPVPGQCGPRRRGPLPAPPFDPRDYWATRKCVSQLSASLGTKLDKADVVDPGAEAEAGKAADAKGTYEGLNRVLGVASDARVLAESKADRATTLAGYGITDAATKEELAAKADLVDGKVPASQLPSYVDDVLEYDTMSAFPATGESGKIYVAKDTNLVYRWSGTQYVEISPSPAFDNTVTETSQNGVKSSGIWSWVKSLLPHWLTSDYAEPATVESVADKRDKDDLAVYSVTRTENTDWTWTGENAEIVEALNNAHSKPYRADVGDREAWVDIDPFPFDISRYSSYGIEDADISTKSLWYKLRDMDSYEVITVYASRTRYMDETLGPEKQNQQIAAVATDDAAKPADGSLMKYDAANDRFVKATAGTDYADEAKGTNRQVVRGRVFDETKWEISVAESEYAREADHAREAGLVMWSYVEAKPTTLSGYGITDGATKTELASAVSTNNPAFVSAVQNTPAPEPGQGEDPPWGTWGTVGAAIAGLVAGLKWLKDKVFDSAGNIQDQFATDLLGKQVAKEAIIYKANTATGLKDRAFNALSLDGTEYNLSTALAAVTPTVENQPRDLLIVATATASTTISFTAGTIKGDKPTIDGAGTWLITLTEYAANTWYCRQIKMEDAA